jgi:hypothetical protein
MNFTRNFAVSALFIFGFLVSSVRLDCTYQGEKICDGAVTKEFVLKVRVCQGTSIKTVLKKSIKAGYPVVGVDTGPGKDCVWYGTTYCEGDVIVDLYRWWFESKCSGGKMRVSSRTLSDVLNDPRYKAQQEEKKAVSP